MTELLTTLENTSLHDYALYFPRYSPWLRQVLSGFYDLQSLSEAHVHAHLVPHTRLPQNMLLAVRRDGYRVIYDLNDGYNFLEGQSDPNRFFEDILAKVDVYFKATCIPERHRDLRGGHKIRPLGPISTFLGSTSNPFDVGLVPLAPKTIARNLLGVSDSLSRFTRTNNRHLWPRQYERSENAIRRPTAVYFTRLFDLNAPEIETDAVRQERADLNAFRCALVRCGRVELGPRFVGGLIPSETARRTAPDCVSHASEAHSRWSYLTTMRDSTVGIATSALHSCASGKLVEYIAASRAVVSQRLRIEMPGDFEVSRNYLAADSPEECIEAAARILDDGNLAYRLMRDNREYYTSYLKPAAMVRRTLRIAAVEACQSV